eukprot:1043632-Amorphochlora_amoeboformis.AAC.1
MIPAVRVARAHDTSPVTSIRASKEVPRRFFSSGRNGKLVEWEAAGFVEGKLEVVRVRRFSPPMGLIES